MAEYQLDPYASQPDLVYEVGTDQPNSPIITGQALSDRTFKAHYGLDTILKKSYDEIYSDMLAGKEDELRTDAANEIRTRKQIVAESAIKQLAQAKQGKLMPQEADGLREIIYNMQKNVDPNSVFETSYGKRYLSILDEMAQRDPDSLWGKAQQVPQLATTLQEVGASLAGKNEIVRTKRQNLEARIGDQGWIPWTADQLKYIFPGYQDSKLRGNVPTEGRPRTLGDALEEQRKALYREDLENGDFDRKLEEIVKKLEADNPTIARDFLKAMEGMSSEDIFEKDMAIVVDTLGLPIGKLAKNLFNFVRGVRPPPDKGGIQLIDRMTGKVEKIEPLYGKDFDKIREEHIKKAVEQTNKIGPYGGLDEFVTDASKAVKDVVESAKTPGVTKDKILDKAGDTAEASVVKSTNIVAKTQAGTLEPTEMARVSLFTAWKGMVESLTQNTGSASRELVTRITNEFNTLERNVWFAVAEAQKIERLPAIMADEVAVRAIKDDIKENYPGLRNTILDIPRFYDETVANVRFAEIHMGNQHGEMFKNKATAASFKYVHGLKDFTVEQQGAGWYLKGYRPLYETNDAVRDLLGKHADATTPLDRWFNKMFSGLPINVNRARTTEDTTSLAQRMNSKIATEAPKIPIKMLQDNAKPIKALKGWIGYRNQRWNDFKDVLVAAMDVPNGEGLPNGKFFDNIGDFEDFFYRAKGIKPDEQQIEAYFAFTRAMEIDRIYRNIAEHRFMSREGTETHRVWAHTTDRASTSPKQYSPEFNGVLRREMPGGTDVALIMGKNVGEERIVNVATLGAEKKELDKLIKSGKKQVVEVWNPELRPFEGFGVVGNERIRYVITDAVETQALKWDHVPRRGGGHVVYDYDYYIKQANVVDEIIGRTNRKWYEGDVTIMPIAIRGMGVEVAGHLDKVRELIKAKDMVAAQKYTEDNLHIDWKTVNGWFHPKRSADGKMIPAKLNKDEKIRVVPRNKSIMDVDNELAQKYMSNPDVEFKDGTKSGSLARQHQVSFTQERDAENLFTLTGGTQEQPLYKIADVERVDPISTMNRALNNIVRSNYMDDYKLFSVENWLAEAGKYLKVQDQDQIRYSPFKYFNNPEFLKGTPEHVKNALMTSWSATHQLVHAPRTLDSWIDLRTQDIIDGVYKKGGYDKAMSTRKVIETTTDPIQFMRNTVFHLKLGAYNISQFLAQSMTYTNIWGVAGPKYAAPSTYASQLHFWSTLNGKVPIMDHLDDLATKLNIPGAARWKPGMFKESIAEGEKTGFFNVGREYATLDDPFANKVVDTAWGQILESGTVFFRYGERNAKLGAWHTAYLEYRTANPFGKIGNAERAKILERADLLNNNMTRASNSALHTGIMSVPSQFYTYQLRATELFFSKRLTGVERARLAFFNVAAYGLPVGAGITGLPVSEIEWPYIGSVRTAARNLGYNAGENFYSTMLMEGIPSYLITMATGKTYNVGDRLGAKGLETIVGLWRNDKTVWDILGGAAGGTFKSILESTDGYWAWASSMMGKGKHFPVTGADHMALLKEISSVNNADTLYTTLTTGRQLTKKGEFLNDSSVTDGFIKFFSGIQPQDSSDVNRIARALGDQDKKWERAKKWAMREMKFAFEAQDANNQQQANKYYTRARGILEDYGVPERDHTDVWLQALRNNDSLVKRLNYDWFIRKAPDDEADKRQELYRRKMELERNRQGG